MSEKLPTVVKYQAESPEQRKVVTTYEMPKGNNRQNVAKCRPLTAKRSASYGCEAISNPWLLRAGLAIVAIVFVVVFVALYSKMQAKVDDMESRLGALEELVRVLEDRIECSVMDQTKPCDQHAAAAASRERKSTGPTTSTRPSTEQNTAKGDGLAFGALLDRRTTSAQKLPPTNPPQATALYTAWGVRSCAGNSERVYDGIGVESSGKSALLCLDELDIRYMNPADISTVARVQIRPVRFANTLGIFEDKNTTNSRLLCAVCQNTQRSAVLVQPGMTECPSSDWQKEYHGYLMTSGNEFVCVKSNPTMSYPSGPHPQVDSLKLAQYPLGWLWPDQPVTCVVCLK